MWNTENYKGEPVTWYTEEEYMLSIEQVNNLESENKKYKNMENIVQDGINEIQNYLNEFQRDLGQTDMLVVEIKNRLFDLEYKVKESLKRNNRHE